MAYYLPFSATSDNRANLQNVVNRSDEAWKIKFSLANKQTSSNVAQRFFNGTSGLADYIAVRWAAVSEKLTYRLDAVDRQFQWSAPVSSDQNRHVWELIYDGTTLSATLDGVPANNTITVSNLQFKDFARFNNANGEDYNFDFYSFEYWSDTTEKTLVHSWKPDPDTGLLFDEVGGNHGTLVNFSANPFVEYFDWLTESVDEGLRDYALHNASSYSAQGVEVNDLTGPLQVQICYSKVHTSTGYIFDGRRAQNDDSTTSGISYLLNTTASSGIANIDVDGTPCANGSEAAALINADPTAKSVLSFDVTGSIGAGSVIFNSRYNLVDNNRNAITHWIKITDATGETRFYDFDRAGDNTVATELLQGKHGTLVNFPGYTGNVRAIVPSSGVEFDGVDDVATMPLWDADTWNEDVLIEVDFTYAGNGQGLLCTGGLNWQGNIEILSDGKIRIYYKNNFGSLVLTAPNWSLGQRYLLGIERVSGALRVYLDSTDLHTESQGARFQFDQAGSGGNGAFFASNIHSVKLEKSGDVRYYDFTLTDNNIVPDTVDGNNATLVGFDSVIYAQQASSEIVGLSWSPNLYGTTPALMGEFGNAAVGWTFETKLKLESGDKFVVVNNFSGNNYNAYIDIEHDRIVARPQGTARTAWLSSSIAGRWVTVRTEYIVATSELHVYIDGVLDATATSVSNFSSWDPILAAGRVGISKAEYSTAIVEYQKAWIDGSPFAYWDMTTGDADSIPDLVGTNNLTLTNTPTSGYLPVKPIQVFTVREDGSGDFVSMSSGVQGATHSLDVVNRYLFSGEFVNRQAYFGTDIAEGHIEFVAEENAMNHLDDLTQATRWTRSAQSQNTPAVISGSFVMDGFYVRSTLGLSENGHLRNCVIYNEAAPTANTVGISGSPDEKSITNCIIDDGVSTKDTIKHGDTSQTQALITDSIVLTRGSGRSIVGGRVYNTITDTAPSQAGDAFTENSITDFDPATHMVDVDNHDYRILQSYADQNLVGAGYLGSDIASWSYYDDSGTPPPTPVPVIKVESFDVDVDAATGFTHTLTNAVDTAHAFVRRTTSIDKQTGRVGNTSSISPNETTGAVWVASSTELEFAQPIDAARKIVGEVWRYDGDAGGDNEFVVRGQFAITINTTNRTASQAVSGIVDRDKCIPFVTGSTSNTTATTQFHSATASVYIDNTDTIQIERGGSSGELVVYVTVVEFTGSNWQVGHGRSANHDTTSEVITLNTASDAVSGSAFDVGDWTTATFIDASLEADTAETGLSDNLGVWATNADTTKAEFVLHQDVEARNDGVSYCHVLKHADMKVSRQSNADFPEGDNTYVTAPWPTGAATDSDLEHLSLEWFSDTSGTGSAHSRGRLSARITDPTGTIEVWVHRSGNDVRADWGVIELGGIQSASGNNNSGTVHTVLSVDGAQIEQAGVLAVTQFLTTNGLLAQQFENSVVTASSISVSLNALNAEELNAAVMLSIQENAAQSLNSLTAEQTEQSQLTDVLAHMVSSAIAAQQQEQGNNTDAASHAALSGLQGQQTEESSVTQILLGTAVSSIQAQQSEQSTSLNAQIALLLNTVEAEEAQQSSVLTVDQVGAQSLNAIAAQQVNQGSVLNVAQFETLNSILAQQLEQVALNPITKTQAITFVVGTEEHQGSVGSVEQFTDQLLTLVAAQQADQSTTLYISQASVAEITAAEQHSEANLLEVGQILNLGSISAQQLSEAEIGNVFNFSSNTTLNNVSLTPITSVYSLTPISTSSYTLEEI